MRCSQYISVLGLLCAPLLTARTISQQQQAAENSFFDDDANSNANDNAAKLWAAAQQIDFDSTLTFSLPNGAENYQIVVDGHPRHDERPSCSVDDLRNVSINGQSLRLVGLDSIPTAVHLEGTIEVREEWSGVKRSLNLLIEADCYFTRTEESDSGYSFAKRHPWQRRTPVLGVNLFWIFDVDGEPWTEGTFTIDNRLLNGHVPQLTVDSPDRGVPNLAHPYTPLTPSISEPHSAAPSPPSSFASSTLSAVSLASHVKPEKSNSQDIPEQFRKLEQLRNDRDATQKALDEQEKLVQSLLAEDDVDVIQELKLCGIKEPGCIFKALSRKFHAYLDLLFGSSDLLEDWERCHGISEMTDSEKIKVLASESDDCRNGFRKAKSRPTAQAYSQLPSEEGDYDSESLAYPDSVFTLSSWSSSSSRTHTLHLAIGAVASLFCLTCVVGCLHRRCCNPRARAARATRREERRARLEYRCAARKQAWRDWWGNRRACLGGRGRNRGRPTSDYEEKRALILQQEAVLENAMQNEIHQLRRQTRNSRGGPIDNVLSMVEEGRAPSPDSRLSSRPSSSGSHRSFGSPPSIAETLPPYRSRSGSGRPPSYNEVDQHAGSVVADGVSVHSDDETRSLRSIRSLRSARTGRSSPASSVVDLSPRHSSETLRTERSSV